MHTRLVVLGVLLTFLTAGTLTAQQAPGGRMGTPAKPCPGPNCPMMGQGAMGMMHGRQHMGGMGGMSFAKSVVMQAEALGLSDEQIGKLHRLAWKQRDAGKEVQKKVGDSMLDVHGALMDPAADAAAIKKAAKAHSDAFHQMVQARIDEREQALKVLSADQRKKLATLREEMHKQMMEE